MGLQPQAEQIVNEKIAGLLLAWLEGFDAGHVYSGHGYVSGHTLRGPTIEAAFLQFMQVHHPALVEYVSLVSWTQRCVDAHNAMLRIPGAPASILIHEQQPE